MMADLKALADSLLTKNPQVAAEYEELVKVAGRAR